VRVCRLYSSPAPPFPRRDPLLLPNSSPLDAPFPLSALVIDDDKVAQSCIFDVVAHRGLSCQVFDSASQFFRSVHREPFGCLVLNSDLPDSPGLGILRELRSRNWSVPTIVTSAKPDISICSEAFHGGALSFLVKPFDQKLLEENLIRAIEMATRQKVDRDHRSAALQKLALLTQREREVMGKIVQGYPIKSISSMSGTSFQAVARHRQRILDKLRLSNDVILTRWVLESQILDDLLIDSQPES
jgi:FixJ family two-component response regulator